MPAAPLTYARCRTLADDAFARGDRQSARIYTQQASAAKRRERFERKRAALESENVHAAKLEAVLDVLMTAESDEDFEQAREHAAQIAAMNEDDVRTLVAQ